MQSGSSLVNFSWGHQVVRLPNYLKWVKATRSRLSLFERKKKGGGGQGKKRWSREGAATWTLTGLSNSVSASIITPLLSFPCHPAHTKPQSRAPRACVHCRGVVSCTARNTYTHTHTHANAHTHTHTHTHGHLRPGLHTPRWRDAFKIHQTRGGSRFGWL